MNSLPDNNRLNSEATQRCPIENRIRQLCRRTKKADPKPVASTLSTVFSATRHAYKRARQRLKWKKRTVNRMMKIAFRKGVRWSQTRGRLRRYLGKRIAKNPAVDNIRIYGEHVFFFSGKKLITLYRLPNRFLAHLRCATTG